MSTTTAHSPRRAWSTLLTRSSYLPGVLILAHTLHAQESAYPLIVLYTPSLPSSSLRILTLESHLNPLIQIRKIEPLLPSGPVTLIAKRFEDTWTKLRVFELYGEGDEGFDEVAFLDADMAIFKPMDGVFDIELPPKGEDGDWLAANHVCVCNLDRDSWAPESWRKENCPWTPLTHPGALTNPSPVPKTTNLPSIDPESADPSRPKQTHTLLNGGFFLFHPSERLWTSLLHHFTTHTEELSKYQFPDQDFLAAFFVDRWRSVGWQFNALKTMRYWHEAFWRDDEVVCLHYIVDKPWAKRIAGDGVAGHLGRDGVTHAWWWEIWEAWRKERSANGEEGKEILELLNQEKLVAEELDENADKAQQEQNRKDGLPVPVPEH